MCNTFWCNSWVECNGTSDGMTGLCVMSDGVVCVMRRGASRVCVMSAAMMSGVCLPSAAMTGMFSSALSGVAWNQNDIYSIVLAPQVAVKNPVYLSGFTHDFLHMSI